jgi:hypothetical protein
VTGRSGFTVTFPDLHEYRRAELMGRLSGLAASVVPLIAIPVGITDRTAGVLATGAMILGFVASAGFSHRCHATMKRLAPLVNERFAVEFLLRTRHEYSPQIDILEVKETVPVYHDDGSVSLWRVKRRGDTFYVSPA